MSKIVVVQHGQSIWDIALQEYGSVEAVFKLQEENSEFIPNLDVDLKAGQKLLITTPVNNSAVANFFATDQLKPCGARTEGVELTGDFNGDFNNDFN